MPTAKRRKKEATTPAKPREPSEDASDMPPVPDDVRYANSLANALRAPDLLHELRGAGGLTSTAFIVGERDDGDDVAVLRAAVATAEAALQTEVVQAADRTNAHRTQGAAPPLAPPPGLSGAAPHPAHT